jgi:hypothetical protein
MRMMAGADGGGNSQVVDGRRADVQARSALASRSRIS